MPPHSTLSYNSRGGYFFFVHSVPLHIPAPFPNPTCRWVLDRGIMEGGTVVPQTMWYPDSASDRRQHVEMGKLQMPIFFEDKDQALGFSLEASVDGQYQILRHANDPAPLGHKTTTHIRIVVSLSFVFGLLTCFNFNSFNNNTSGLVIINSSAKFQFVTRQVSATPSPWPNFLARSDGQWTLSSGSVFELSLPSSSPCNKPYLLGLRIRLWVCRRAKQTMADRTKRYPTQ